MSNPTKEFIQAEAQSCCAQCRANVSGNLAGGHLQGALRCIMYCRNAHLYPVDIGKSEIIVLPDPPSQTTVEIRIESDFRLPQPSESDPEVKMSCVHVKVVVDVPAVRQTVVSHMSAETGDTPTVPDALLELEHALLIAAADVRRQRLTAERVIRSKNTPST